MTMVGTDWGRRTSVVSWGFVVFVVLLAINSTANGSPWTLAAIPGAAIIGSLGMGQYAVVIGDRAVRSLWFGFPIVRLEHPFEVLTTRRGTVVATRGRALLLVAPSGSPDAEALAGQVLEQVLRVHGEGL